MSSWQHLIEQQQESCWWPCCASPYCYVVCGLVPPGTFLDSLEKYDVSGDAWSTETDRPTAAYGAGCSPIQSSQSLRVTGGAVSGGTRTAVTQSFNAISGTWNAETSLVVGCHRHADQASGATSEVFCGYSSTWTTAHYQSGLTGSWSTLTASPRIFGEFIANSCIAAGQNLLVGCHGSGTNYYKYTENYDDGSDAFTAKTDHPDPMAGMSATHDSSDMVSASGGVNNTSPFVYDTSRTFSHAGNSWTTKTSMSAAYSLFKGLTPTAGYGYSFGGQSIGATPVDVVQRYDFSGDSWSAKTSMTTARQDFSGSALSL